MDLPLQDSRIRGNDKDVQIETVPKLRLNFANLGKLRQK